MPIQMPHKHCKATKENSLKKKKNWREQITTNLLIIFNDKLLFVSIIIIYRL